MKTSGLGACAPVLLAVLACAAPDASAYEITALSSDAPLALTHLDVDLEVRGPVAAGTLTFGLTAAQGARHHASLRFPLPAGAVVHGAELYDADLDTWLPAETVGRQQGTEIFETAAAEGEGDPLLIQRIGVDLYRARVFPVSADTSTEVRVHFAQPLRRRGEGVIVDVALDSQADVPAWAGASLAIEVRTAPGAFDADPWSGMAGLPRHEDLQDPSAGRFVLSLPGPRLDEDLSLTLLPTGGEPPDATALAYVPEHPALLPHAITFWRPDLSELPGVGDIPRHIVFVVDVSHSMTGAKIAVTRDALHAAIDALEPTDRFGLVAFSGEAYPFGMMMRAGDDTDDAHTWIDGLAPLSGTDLAAGLIAGLELAMNDPATGPSRSIDLFVLTDGNPTHGPTTLASVGEATDEAAGEQPYRVFALGIGEDLDPDLLDGLANRTDGAVRFALSDGAIEPEALALFELARGGGLHDVVIDLEEGPLLGGATRSLLATGHELRLPAVFDELPDALHLSLEGRNTSGELGTLAIEAAVHTAADDEDPFFRIAAPLFAGARAHALEDAIDRDGETSARVAELVALSQTYGVVTRYSALLVLEGDEAWAARGLERVSRDPAGIALEPVSGSSAHELRIGGAGAADDPPPFDDTAGCACARPVDGRPAAALALIVGVSLVGRSRRRRRR